MKVLVTGANGFLGAWLTRRLLTEGHEVTALVRKNSDLTELEGSHPQYAYGDVTDFDSLLAAFANKDIVFHLAGVVAYNKAERPLMDRVNVQGTKNVVEACLSRKVPELLHVSSVVAVGASFEPVTLTEESPYTISDLNLGYFETKRAAEKIVMDAVRLRGLHAVCVNPSTIYGFGDAKKGSRKTQVKVANQKFPFYTSGGVNVVAVEDVVEGIILAIKKGRPGQRYILSGENMRIKDLFEKIAAFSGVKPPHLKMPDWALHALGFTGDQLARFNVKFGVSSENAYTATMYHWFDSGKARTELGFQPGSSDKAIENSVRWMKDNGYIK